MALAELYNSCCVALLGRECSAAAMVNRFDVHLTKFRAVQYFCRAGPANHGILLETHASHVHKHTTTTLPTCPTGGSGRITLHYKPKGIGEFIFVCGIS